MFESIGRSIELFKTSGGILMADKELLVFPLLSGIISLIVLATFILPLILAEFVQAAIPAGAVFFYGMLFAFYLVSYFVVIFFNTALISCVNARLQGKEMSVGEGLSNALRHFPSILGWALVSATVGILLHLLRERGGIFGQIASALVGGVWGLVTFFVVPVLVLEDKGVVDATKESVALFRKTWGESVVGSVSIGVIFGAIMVVGLLGVLAALVTRSITVMILACALFILLITVVSVVASAMQGIFVTALYTYAKTGNVPTGFGKGVLENAFVPKQPPFGTGNI